MKQGLLAFQYEEEKSTTGMTALSGLDDVRGVDARTGLRRPAWVCEEEGWTDTDNHVADTAEPGRKVLEKDRFVQGTSTCRDPWDASEQGAQMARRALAEPRWCSGIWRGSTTQVRRPNGRRTEHSSLPPSFEGAGEGERRTGGLRTSRPHTQATLDRTPAWWRATRRKLQGTGRISRSRGQRPTEFRDGNVPAEQFEC